MSFPTIPAGLPSSCVVLDVFSEFCNRFPFASGSSSLCGSARFARGLAPLDVTGNFGRYLRGFRKDLDAAAILRRCEFPL